MRSYRSLTALTDAPVLVRAALNVPMDRNKVTNAYRLRRAVPTLKFLSEQNARVIVISHLGSKGTESLAPVAEALGELLPRVSFYPETTGAKVRDRIRAMRPGDILVLENLRRHKGEKEGDPRFSEELANLADYFIQDSFDTCHRPHASIVGVPKLLPHYAGQLLIEEVEALKEALAPTSPSLAVIGGAKFSTKEPVLKALLETYDKVFVGGALANDFLRAKGYAIGKSLVSDGDPGDIKKLLDNPKLILPVDVRTENRTTDVASVEAQEAILDHGPATDDTLAKLAKESTSVLWNGPLGLYEKGFSAGTDTFARAVATSDAHSVVGGGDTIAAIEKLGLFSQFSFVSTGGGAMLDFLANGTLPGIDALR